MVLLCKVNIEQTSATVYSITRYLFAKEKKVTSDITKKLLKMRKKSCLKDFKIDDLVNIDKN